jgi:hypothetical protein
MRIAMWAAAGLLLAAGTAGAQAVGASNVETESGTVFTSVLRIIVRWVFPVCAAYCFLHGVIGKGVKRGEWDMAGICVVAAVALALFPKVLTALFGVTL